MVVYNPGVKEGTANRKSPLRYGALLGSFSDFVSNPLLLQWCECNNLFKVSTGRVVVCRTPGRSVVRSVETMSLLSVGKRWSK